MVYGLAPARAQGRLPRWPISPLVSFAPGGMADLTARAVAAHMGKSLGQPVVVVENKPSAGSIVASQAVAPARPDEHALPLMSNGNAVSVACSSLVVDAAGAVCGAGPGGAGTPVRARAMR